MVNKHQLLYAHAVIVLPDKRVLLRRQQYRNGSFSEWSATVEKAIFKTDNPNYVINKVLLHDFNINLSINYKMPTTTIRQLDCITVCERNIVIFPFVVEAKKMLKLKSGTDYQFLAKPFNVLLDSIMKHTIYNHNPFHTSNTIHVMKEVQLKGVLTYVPIEN